jgi:hypothetical protein
METARRETSGSNSSLLILAANARSALSVAGCFRVLPFPCLLLFASEESHLGRFPLHASAFFYGLHLLIYLHLIQHSLFVFAVFLCKTTFVSTLATLDVVAETPVEQSAV